MTARRPLVIVSGLQQELPAGDDITDPVLAAVSQIAGLNGSTLLEVEAKYGAARIVLRSNDSGSIIEQAYSISHNCMGFSGSFAFTTTWPAEVDMASIEWFGPGIAIIRKLWISLATSQLTGARVGLGRAFLTELKSAVGSPGTNAWITPLVSNGNVLNANSSQNNLSLRTRELTPQIILASPGFNIGAAGAGLGFQGGTQSTTKTVGEAVFGVKAAIGTDLPPTTLIDSYAGGQPCVLEAAQGLVAQLIYPAAGTSQTVNYAINVVWDEWFPSPQSTI
jgi:hypothetical protein